MKIKETIERECCEPKDIKPYHGALQKKEGVVARYPGFYFFCKHCGQAYKYDHEHLPTTSIAGLEPIIIVQGHATAA